MIYVTGSDGVLGTALKKIIPDAIYWSKRDLDITDEQQCKKVLKKLTTEDWIINCAAATDVDWCEAHPNECYDINLGGVFNLKTKTTAKIVQISTASVFGEYGIVQPEIDFKEKHPLSVYSKSKYDAEGVLSNVNMSIIIRTCWLFSGEDNDKKFIRNITDKLNNGEDIKVAIDVFGQLMYAEDLAKFIRHCIDNKKYGIWHAASHDSTDRLWIAHHIKGELFLDKQQKSTQGNLTDTTIIDRCDLRDFNLPASRPHHEYISVEKTERETGWKFRSWKEMVDEFLDKYLK